MKKIYIFILIILSNICLSAQTDITTYFMRSNPYSNHENPASYLPYNGYFGFLIGNPNINFSNTAFHYNSMFRRDANGFPVEFTTNKFIDKLHKTENWLNFSLNEEIFGFGIRQNFLFFSVSYRIKVEEYFKFSKDIFELTFKGNMNFLDKDNPANLNANLSLNAYQEISFGIQAEVGKRIYIGARPKLLFGLANINTNKLNVQVFTDPTSYDITMNYAADITAVTAVPSLFSGDSTLVKIQYEDWRNIFKNVGYAIDIGGFFRINDYFGVGAAVNNIGFINWKIPGVRISSELSDQGQFYDNGSFFFNGLTGEQIINLVNNENGYRKEFLDTLLQYFPVNSDTYISGKKWLNPRFNIEGYFQLSPAHRFSAFFQGTIIGKSFYPRLTLAYSLRLGNILEVCANYSIMPSSYSNLGVGVGFSLGPVYLYAATDNIIGLCTPFNTNMLNAQVGLAFKWGKTPEKVIKKSKEAEPNEEVPKME